MSNKIIRLTEEDIRNMVKESISNIIKEEMQENIDLDFHLNNLTQMIEKENQTLKITVEDEGFYGYGSREFEWDSEDRMHFYNVVVEVKGWCEGEDKPGTYYDPPEYATPMWELASVHVSYYNNETDQELEFDVPIDQNSQAINHFVSELEKRIEVEVLLEEPTQEWERPDEY